jgi:hypothetical protein
MRTRPLMTLVLRTAPTQDVEGPAHAIEELSDREDGYFSFGSFPVIGVITTRVTFPLMAAF